MKRTSPWLFRALGLACCAGLIGLYVSSSDQGALAQKTDYEDFLKGDRKEVFEVEGTQVWRYDSKTIAALLSKSMGMPVLAPQAMGGVAFIHTGNKLEESPVADQIIAGMLQGAGFAVVVDGGLARVMSYQDARAAAPAVTTGQLGSRKSYEVVRFKISVPAEDAFSLRDQFASNLTPELGQMLAFDSQRGSVVVCDTVANARAINALIDSIVR